MRPTIAAAIGTKSIYREDWFGAPPYFLSRTVSFTSQPPALSP